MTDTEAEDSNGAATPLEQVLLTELHLLRTQETLSSVPLRIGYYSTIAALGEYGPTALCLSGGGIRSGAFSLGVLQGLAVRGHLENIDYLSTVSGGGYTGAWLTAWRKRLGGKLDPIIARLKWPNAEGATPPSALHDPLLNLRRRTRYLDPDSGIFGTDTWTNIAVYARNLFIVNLLIVPLITGLLILAKVGLLYLRREDSSWLTPSSILRVMAIAFVVGWGLMAVGRPSWSQRPTGVETDDTDGDSGSVEKANYLTCLRIGSSWLMAVSLIYGMALFLGQTASGQPVLSYIVFGVYGAAIGAASMILGLILSSVRGTKYPPDILLGVVLYQRKWLFVVNVIYGTVAGSLAGGLLKLTVDVVFSSTRLLGFEATAAMCLVIGPYLFVVCYELAESLYLGFSTRKPRQKAIKWNDLWGDEERQWVARTAGALSLFALAWAAFVGAAFFASDIVQFLFNLHHWKKAAAIAAAVSSALGSVGLGASSLTGPKSGAGNKLKAATVLAIATPIFYALLLLGLSAALDSALFKQPLFSAMASRQLLPISAEVSWYTENPLRWDLAIAGLCLLVPVLLAFFFNINRYSLHDFYRLRLTREFLGASNRKRKGDPWTGLDASDDVRLADVLGSNPPPGTVRLYPVINATLNMLEKGPLSWGYRKGLPFAFTPRFCGAAELNYRPTSGYASGMLLGAAMAISGAAVSPNAGYSTMKGVSLLLTMFNVRLGVWAGNPKQSAWRNRGPSYALKPLLSEAVMKTSTTADYVYLTDGGHFDNLGLFEMLRRRCRRIIVVDGGSDPKSEFLDLGDATRLARTELDIVIEIATAGLKNRPAPPQAGPRVAVGKIIYPPDPISRIARTEGELLYIKSGFQGIDEPPDVRAFAAANPLFPHDPTTDQFFDEARFESYRALGEWMVNNMAPPSPPDETLAELFSATKIKAERYLTGIQPPRPSSTWWFTRLFRRERRY